jgi:spermidine synthase
MMRLALLLTIRPHATAEDVREAVRLARRAADLTEGRDPAALETLAAAYASAGDFREAVTTEQRAAELAAAAGDGALSAATAAALELYRHGRLLPRGDAAPAAR